MILYFLQCNSTNFIIRIISLHYSKHGTARKSQYHTSGKFLVCFSEPFSCSCMLRMATLTFSQRILGECFTHAYIMIIMKMRPKGALSYLYSIEAIEIKGTASLLQVSNLFVPVKDMKRNQNFSNTQIAYMTTESSLAMAYLITRKIHMLIVKV